MLRKLMTFELRKPVSSRTCLNGIDRSVIAFCDDISSAVLRIFLSGFYWHHSVLYWVGNSNLKPSFNYCSVWW